LLEQVNEELALIERQSPECPVGLFHLLARCSESAPALYCDDCPDASAVVLVANSVDKTAVFEAIDDTRDAGLAVIEKIAELAERHRTAVFEQAQ
jgi:hypothetical protein